MSFSSLGLSDALVRAVADVGYTAPTPIQTQAIPAVLAGRDLLAGAQTGTGKTAGFVLPILERLSQTAPAGRRHIRTLILTPTRELAAQVEESVRVYGKHTKISSGLIFGGVSFNPQVEMLKRGIDILVATPGRLLDHHGQKTIDLSHVEILVLDEADRMLDMGFIHDIKRVLRILPPRRQNLLFSATFSDEIRALANGLLNSPEHIQVTPRNTTVEAVAQKIYAVDAKRKPELLMHLVKEHNWFQVLVFTRTKHGANKLAAQLEKAQIPSAPIHGNKSQNARTRALADFKSNKLQVLVATDIAARGIDIDNLPHVVNFELPNVPEDYVHRIGRTGRAGASGEAISLVAPEEVPLLKDIERFTRQNLPRTVLPGFERGSAPITVVADVPVARDRQEAKGRGSNRGGERHGRAGERGGTRPAKDAPRPRDAQRAPQPGTRSGQGTTAAADKPARHQHASAPRHAAPPAHDPKHGASRDTHHAARPPRGREPADANGVRSNLPPGWPGSSGSGRR
jgi:ATP-dependent RNA helicase RhlE